MGGPAIEFWFDFASSYSHISAQRIEALVDRAGAVLLLRPFYLAPIFKAQGWTDSPFKIYPAKGAYMWTDMERECRKYQIPYRRPSSFPRGSRLATRIAVTSQDQPFVRAFVRAVYRANFYDDLNIGDEQVVREILTSCGVQDIEDVIRQAASDEARDAVREQSTQAAARGIFGAPTFFVEGEMFWGNDRLDDAITALRRRRA